MCKSEICVNLNYDMKTEKHTRTMTQPGLGAGPSEKYFLEAIYI